MKRLLVIAWIVFIMFCIASMLAARPAAGQTTEIVVPDSTAARWDALFAGGTKWYGCVDLAPSGNELRVVMRPATTPCMSAGSVRPNYAGCVVTVADHDEFVASQERFRFYVCAAGKKILLIGRQPINAPKSRIALHERRGMPWGRPASSQR